MVEQASRRQFLKYASVGAASLSTLPVTASARRTTRIDTCTTITERGQYELSSDITHSASGICIRIQASNVIFDGNGFAVRGAGTFTNTGISIDDTSRNVEVRNLEVSDLTYGFNVVGPRARFENVVAANNGVSGCIINPNANRTSITNSDISGNGSSGIGAVIADGHVISDNTIDSNGGSGIVFRQGVSRSTVRRNSISRNHERGVTAWEGGDRNKIHDNVAEGNGIRGISINDFNPERATNVSIKGNRIVDNGEDGLFLRQVDRSRVIRNTARLNGDDGIELEDSTDNRLIRNVACDNGGDAIVIGPNSTNNLLRANTTDC